MKSNTLALFGAGKIGRSFIAQIFARNDYEVVFIDVDPTVVGALNADHRYRMITLNNDGSKEEYWVEGVRAVDGRDRSACTELLSQVSLVATSVGANAIPAVCSAIADAAHGRNMNSAPLDIILAENMPKSAAIVRRHLANSGIASDDQPGLIEASVGKTSPDVPDGERGGDPLLVYGDSYNTLIVSAHGWRGQPPQFPQLHLVDSIAAYVDRKLFIHNLAHCALAYFGHQALPDVPYIHQIAEHAETRARVRALIDVVAQALALEYPDSFTVADMRQYVDDVLGRIGNPALRDGVWRVGRDIPRKLGRNERVVGSMLMVARHGLSIDAHVQLYVAALSFHARDERGNYAPPDEQFHSAVRQKGVAHALRTVSQFSDSIEDEKSIIMEIKKLSEAKHKILEQEVV